MSLDANELTIKAWSALGGDPGAIDSLAFVGAGALPSTFRVSDFASAAIGTAALALLELFRVRGAPPRAEIDRRLCSYWFGLSLRPSGWKLPAPWDPLAGDYRASDGWIRLHTNAPHHRLAAERVLGARGDREEVARVVAAWRKHELETAIVEAQGCAAEMRTAREWAEHPQGSALAREPLAHTFIGDAARLPAWPLTPTRPLAGVKVLDLTRVLAGPVATRFLAANGADVLRVDPPAWDEPAIVPEVTLGKRCTRLDLRRNEDRATFEELLSRADIILHGYRPGALDRLGFDPARRRALSPGLIDVCLCAYGWSGPWARRRGFDSLVQMSAGIADAGMHWRGADKPVPLPVQALDHATGYLMAAVAVRAMTRRLTNGQGTEARLSLARTAGLLADAGPADPATPPFAPETAADLSPGIERTDWGQAQRLNPPIRIEGAPMHWDYPARQLGWSAPRWD